MSKNKIIDADLLATPVHTNGHHNMYLRAELAQEIITRKPDFIERWALLVFFIVLLTLLGSTYFIHYPDIIETNATLTASNAPKEIIPVQQGRLIKLFSHNNEPIKKDQVIGWIESTASHTEVIALAGKLDKSADLLQKNELQKAVHLFDQHYEHLGELQTGYQQFIAVWQQVNDYWVNDFYNRKKSMLQQDIQSLQLMNSTIGRQKEITEQDLQLAEESFKMNEELANDKIISKEDYRNEKSRFLSKQSSLPQLKAQQINNETQMREKQKEIYELDHAIAQQKVIFEQALQTIRSQVADWMHKYVLLSPINGKVVFLVPLQENRYLQPGRLLGYIVPDSTQYYAEATLPQFNFGKIDTGLQVQLRFDAYPYQEFGFVKGSLNYISRIPADSGFLSAIRLDNGLYTNYGKLLEYKSGLSARAIIITHNISLMQRLYYNLVDVTSVKK